MILCLAWWDRAYGRYLEEQREARQAEAKAVGTVTNFDGLSDHDADWLNIVNDVAFVMQKARDCRVPTRGMPSPSRGGKKKHQGDPQHVPAVRTSSRKKSRV